MDTKKLINIWLFLFNSVGAGCVGLMDSSQQLLQFIKPIIQFNSFIQNNQICSLFNSQTAKLNYLNSFGVECG